MQRLVFVIFDIVRTNFQPNILAELYFNLAFVRNCIATKFCIIVQAADDRLLIFIGFQKLIQEAQLQHIVIPIFFQMEFKSIVRAAGTGIFCSQHPIRDCDALREFIIHFTLGRNELFCRDFKAHRQLRLIIILVFIKLRALVCITFRLSRNRSQIVFCHCVLVCIIPSIRTAHVDGARRGRLLLVFAFQRRRKRDSFIRGILVPLLVLLGRRSPGGGGGFSIRVVLRVRRKGVRRGGVAQNRVGVRRDGQLGNGVVHVARDQGQRRRAACRVNVRDNRAGLDLIVAAQKYDVAGHSLMAGALQLTRLTERHRPGVDARGVRRGQEVLVHAGVMQAERGEHAVPAAVGAAVPCAVAGIAAAGAVVVQLPVAGALGIADLAGRDGHRVLRPVAGQGLLREGPGPVGLPLGVGLGVAVAVRRVGVLRQGADQLTLIAGVGVDVLPCPGFLRGRGAVQHRCVTAVGMGVLLQAAGGFIRHGRADQLEPPEHRQTDQQRQHPQQTGIAMLPPVVPVKAFLILFYDVFHKASLVYFCNKSEILSKGYTLKKARPTICSFSMQPITLLRLSTEVERWSPITK